MDPYPEPGEIKPFLLHPYALVRQNVAAYFRDACSGDEDLIPLIVEACKRNGNQENIAGLEAGRCFTLSGGSVALVLALLGQVGDGRTIYVLNDILSAMPAPLFHRYERQLRRTANVLPSTTNVLCQRCALAERHPEKLWGVLEHFIESFRGRDCPDRINRTFAANLVEALALHVDDGPSSKTLIERLERSSGRDDWGALYIIDLLGKRRIKEATPAILECFRFDSGHFGARGAEAIIRIGDVEAIRLLRDRMIHEGENFRYHAAETLAGFKHPEAEQALIDLLEVEESPMLKTRYCDGLCRHYSVKGDSLVRRQIETATEVDAAILKGGVLVTSIVRSLNFPEAETWRKEIESPRRDPEDFHLGPVFEIWDLPAGRA